jgi:hypothetical protein
MMMRPSLGTDFGSLIAIVAGAAVSVVLTARLVTPSHVFHEVEHFHVELAEHDHPEQGFGDHFHGDHFHAAHEHDDHHHIEHALEAIVAPHLKLNGDRVIDRELRIVGPEGEPLGWQGDEIRVRVPESELRENTRIRIQRRERMERRPF